ncbi:hypothetical protein ACIA74_41055 [Streptomyces sp. NPDC051658]|uniref:hypothetical protein n=1 Tax=Streptomyces sp. NPDC051658 TaxID=3365667 RepID=UPI00379A06D5
MVKQPPPELTRARGRRPAAAHTHGHDEILGTAYSDHDLVFLEAAGTQDPGTAPSSPAATDHPPRPAPHESSASAMREGREGLSDRGSG